MLGSRFVFSFFFCTRAGQFVRMVALVLFRQRRAPEVAYAAFCTPQIISLIPFAVHPIQR